MAQLPTYVTEKHGTVYLGLTIRPRSSRNAILGEYQSRLKIALTAPPIDGEANGALIDFMAKALKIPKSSISILRGANSKNKTLVFTDVSAREITLRITRVLGSMTSGRRGD